MSQENLQTMIMQNCWGGKRGVLWDCASSELGHLRLRHWLGRQIPWVEGSKISRGGRCNELGNIL